MQQYLTQRLLLSIPVIIGVTVIVFAILHLTPGDPVRIMAGPRASEERIQEIRAQLGLDRPIYQQYTRWLWRVAQGDLGISIASKQPVSQMIGERLPLTLRLSLMALVLSVTVGIPLGVFAAVNHQRWLDHLITFCSLFFFSIPAFWLGLMLILCFSLWLRWTPISGYQGLAALILPTLTLALPQSGAMARFVRTEMLDVLQAEYMKTAHAKGLQPRLVLYRHALRNALIPLVTIVTFELPAMFGGAILTETVFAWPGIGRLM
ncbi:MAG: ABC transporter permease, partial [Caldilineaceae bacterium]|nr:ABC transporter permease [Caldilineaceae bacterium]